MTSTHNFRHIHRDDGTKILACDRCGMEPGTHWRFLSDEDGVTLDEFELMCVDCTKLGTKVQ